MIDGLTASRNRNRIFDKLLFYPVKTLQHATNKTIFYRTSPSCGVFLCLRFDMNRSLLIEQLSRDEGLRLRPYRCSAGKLTIGYGRNLEDNGISREEAEQMLHNDIDDVVRELKTIKQYGYLDPIRQTVLANMAYNLGIPTLKKFRNMLANISLGDYENAAKEMLNSKWARQVGDRAIRLAEIMRTGEIK